MTDNPYKPPAQTQSTVVTSGNRRAQRRYQRGRGRRTRPTRRLPVGMRIIFGIIGMGLVYRAVMMLYLLSRQLFEDNGLMVWMNNLLLLLVGSVFLYLAALGGRILWKLVEKIVGR